MVVLDAQDLKRGGHRGFLSVGAVWRHFQGGTGDRGCEGRGKEESRDELEACVWVGRPRCQIVKAYRSSFDGFLVSSFFIVNVTISDRSISSEQAYD